MSRRSPRPPAAKQDRWPHGCPVESPASSCYNHLAAGTCRGRPPDRLNAKRPGRFSRPRHVGKGDRAMCTTDAHPPQDGGHPEYSAFRWLPLRPASYLARSLSIFWHKRFRSTGFSIKSATGSQAPSRSLLLKPKGKVSFPATLATLLTYSSPQFRFKLRRLGWSFAMERPGTIMDLPFRYPVFCRGGSNE